MYPYGVAYCILMCIKYKTNGALKIVLLFPYPKQILETCTDESQRRIMAAHAFLFKLYDKSF